MCVFVVCCVLFLFSLFYLRVCFLFSFCFIFIEYYTCFRLIANTTHTYLYTQNSIISISVASKSPEPKVERTSNTEKSNAKQKEIGRCHLVRSLSIRVWCLASSIISISANGFVVAYVYISLVHFISFHILELHFIAFRHIFYLNIAFFSGIFFSMVIF